MWGMINDSKSKLMASEGQTKFNRLLLDQDGELKVPFHSQAPYIVSRQKESQGPSMLREQLMLCLHKILDSVLAFYIAPHVRPFPETRQSHCSWKNQMHQWSESLLSSCAPKDEALAHSMLWHELHAQGSLPTCSKNENKLKCWVCDGLINQGKSVRTIFVKLY